MIETNEDGSLRCNLCGRDPCVCGQRQCDACGEYGAKAEVHKLSVTIGEPPFQHVSRPVEHRLVVCYNPKCELSFYLPGEMDRATLKAALEILSRTPPVGRAPVPREDCGGCGHPYCLVCGPNP